MKERPILFNGDMVRAILAGKKTQTRRPVVPQVPNDHDGISVAKLDLSKSPFGKPGDWFWVRERAKLLTNGTREFFIYPGDKGVRFRYEADNTLSEWLDYPERLKTLEIGKCVPNGCFRELARIKLEVKRVWVERLQDIKNIGATAEGLDHIADFGSLWNSVYDKKGLGWHDNPWVWACEFNRLEPAP